jgi:hypothetical protein
MTDHESRDRSTPAEALDVERLILDGLSITDGTPDYYDREVGDIRAVARNTAARLRSPKSDPPGWDMSGEEPPGHD